MAEQKGHAGEMSNAGVVAAIICAATYTTSEKIIVGVYADNKDEVEQALSVADDEMENSVSLMLGTGMIIILGKGVFEWA